MALPSNWKMGKCLEWFTEAPLPNRPRESPVFFIQNIECSFELCSDNCFYLYLKPKTSDSKLKPFSLTIYSDQLRGYQVNFSDPNQALTHFFGAHITKRARREGEGYGPFMKFLFIFGTAVDGPLLPLDTKSDDKSVQVSSYVDSSCLMKDFSKLLDEGPNHDVEFVCGDQTVRAHKNVLCCRSDVFASMLQSDMVEGKTGRVKIEDMDVAVFRRFLRYLYTGVLPELTVDSAFPLYEVADKYLAGGVKKQCADFLTDNLSPENACEILIFANRHNDLDFKKDVLEYVMKENIPCVWETLVGLSKENPLLAFEAFSSFCQQFRRE